MYYSMELRSAQAVQVTSDAIIPQFNNVTKIQCPPVCKVGFILTRAPCGSTMVAK